MINVEKLNICVTYLIYASKSFLCQNSALKIKLISFSHILEAIHYF